MQAAGLPDTIGEMTEAAWELAALIVADETRATAIAAAMARGEPVTISKAPFSGYAADIRRQWRDRLHTEDPYALAPEVAVIFEQLGEVTRRAVADDEWDWGDHPPASFASWLSAALLRLRDQDR